MRYVAPAKCECVVVDTHAELDLQSLQKKRKKERDLENNKPQTRNCFYSSCNICVVDNNISICIDEIILVRFKVCIASNPLLLKCWFEAGLPRSVSRNFLRKGEHETFVFGDRRTMNIL